MFCLSVDRICSPALFLRRDLLGGNSLSVTHLPPVRLGPAQPAPQASARWLARCFLSPRNCVYTMRGPEPYTINTQRMLRLSSLLRTWRGPVSLATAHFSGAQ
jgi:hypothetical protein